MSRLIRSSSMGGSADLLGRFYNPVAVRQNKQKQTPAAAAEKPRKSIFTFNSPPRREIVNCRPENFLDACALCKKGICKNKDRYMYGYLQAFCSPHCRDSQIAKDEEVNPPSPSARRKTGRKIFKSKKRY